MWPWRWGLWKGCPWWWRKKNMKSFIDAAEKNGQIWGPLRRDLRLYWQELTLAGADLGRSWPCCRSCCQWGDDQVLFQISLLVFKIFKMENYFQIFRSCCQMSRRWRGQAPDNLPLWGDGQVRFQIPPLVFNIFKMENYFQIFRSCCQWAEGGELLLTNCHCGRWSGVVLLLLTFPFSQVPPPRWWRGRGWRRRRRERERDSNWGTSSPILLMSPWLWRMTNHQVVLSLEKRRGGRRRRRRRSSTPRKRRNSTPRKRRNSTPRKRGSSLFDGVGWEKKKKKKNFVGT